MLRNSKRNAVLEAQTKSEDEERPYVRLLATRVGTIRRRGSEHSMLSSPSCVA
jgi:hypothetical protein